MKRLLVTSLFVAVYIFSGQVASVQGKDVKNVIIPGQYIVVFNDAVTDVDGAIDDVVHGRGIGLLHKYGNVIKGFSGTIPVAQLDAIKHDSRVQFVSEDRVVTISGKPEETKRGGGGSSGSGGTTQPPQIIPTGIARINATSSAATGADIGVAVIDTGIDLSHPDLKANIGITSKTCVTGTRSANDDNGHGTHVAGTIAAADNTIGVVGVAPQAKLYAVKVLNKNGSGTWSGVICGIDWVTANAATYNIRVANMSLGGGGTSDNNCGKTNNDALHKAICNSAAKGVTYVVAAGNENADSTKSVPAAYDDAVITVSALADSDGGAGGNGVATAYGADDTFASFSNFGSPVDIGAPGVSILSTWKGGTYKTISGTSMATPHVTGAAALYIQSHIGALWTDVRDVLRSLGEVLGGGHTDPSGLHPEPVLQAQGL